MKLQRQEEFEDTKGTTYIKERTKWIKQRKQMHDNQTLSSTLV